MCYGYAFSAMPQALDILRLITSGYLVVNGSLIRGCCMDYSLFVAAFIVMGVTFDFSATLLSLLKTMTGGRLDFTQGVTPLVLTGIEGGLLGIAFAYVLSNYFRN